MSQVIETRASSRGVAGERLREMEAETVLAPISSRRAVRAPGSEEEPQDNTPESLFERFAWLYVFCREKLFRDDTDRMIRALWPKGSPPDGTELIELGCGPGFYSCNLARRFPKLRVTGVDQSDRQLCCARGKADGLGLSNCHFAKVDVLEPSRPDETFDVLIASRLFTVLSERSRAVSEMYRVLRPGGRCLIAEPRYAVWASIPLYAMWMLAGMSRLRERYREPRSASVLKRNEFARLFQADPWLRCRIWIDGRYQYALCEKG